MALFPNNVPTLGLIVESERYVVRQPVAGKRVGTIHNVPVVVG